MQVEEGFEVAVRLVEQLQAGGVVVVALKLVVLTLDREVVDPAVAVLRLQRKARRPVGAERQRVAALEVAGAEAAVAGIEVALLPRAGAHRIELDHAGRCVAAEERALRPGEHLDPLEVEQREALQDRVLLHHVVVNQRDRLRGVEVEVGVAVAADVEARKGAPERRLDVQAGHPARDEAHVFARRVEHVELLARNGRDRTRHVLDVFGLALGGDVDGGQHVRGRGGRRRWPHVLCAGCGR